MKITQQPIIARQPSAVDPAYYQSLVISGMKCFREKTTFNFADSEGRPAQWTVILGDNGVGKTTVLQCLAGMSVRAGLIRNKDGTEVPLLEQHWGGQAWIAFHLDRHSLGQTKTECKAMVVLGSTFARKEPLAVRDWDFSITSKKRPDGQSEINESSTRSKPEGMAGLQVYAYGAGRRMAVTSRIPYNADAVRGIFNDDFPLTNAEEWLLELDHLAKTDSPSQSRARHQRKAVEQLLTRVLPEIEAIRIDVDKSTISQGETLRVRFKNPYGWVRIDQLSFGYQTMVSWLVDLTRRLYTRYPNSNDPIAEPAIALVDEIDLHLHPKWQQTVMDYLSDRFVNTQFIVTAHSPLIIQSQRATNVILLERIGEKVVARQDLNEIKKWRVDQILASDLFGLKRTRAPEIEKLYDERSTLLGNARLTAEQKRRLAELNRQIEQLPTADTPEMIEVEALLRKAAKEHLQKTSPEPDAT
jgi:predicted ATP-binding protein involved in virulence